ncbi:hypothetical protein EB241_08280 [Erwinia psidii]|uniref:Uncharacterized protein n=1 Tax=Erwinia psidii TaxID=69224 RepID=A0A3N6URQ5_9GAMM|nr:hypothetical protein EB241_08280 [Erwinia psidii]
MANRQPLIVLLKKDDQPGWHPFVCKNPALPVNTWLGRSTLSALILSRFDFSESYLIKNHKSF